MISINIILSVPEFSQAPLCYLILWESRLVLTPKYLAENEHANEDIIVYEVRTGNLSHKIIHSYETETPLYDTTLSRVQGRSVSVLRLK